MDAGFRDQIRREVHEVRRKLLDLTLRNRMLNYRSSKRTTIRIIQEESVALLGLVVDEGKRMTFVGQPDVANQDLFSGREDDVAMADLRQRAEDELDAFLINPVLPTNVLDTRLNCDDRESILQPKLRMIQRAARLANEELGINTLFLTLGMLDWKDDTGRSCSAPLLFVPVELEQSAQGVVRLRHDGSDVGPNLPLAAKLVELNLKLPEWDEDRGLQEYFDKVESTVARRGEWRLRRDEIRLDFFNYEKYAMYVDLGGDLWPHGRKPWDNPNLMAIFGPGYPEAKSPLTEETFLDDVRTPEQCAEVFDADSSQILALARAAEGHSMLVEGPPGTGKSQTIANMIAEAVMAGKTILFVSAKRAALDVVKRRLTEAELGPMCLDMHDKMTNRREFYAEIKRTVERRVRPADESTRMARLAEVREVINAHARAMGSPVGSFGSTPFDAIGELVRLGPASPGERIPWESLRGLSAAALASASPRIQAVMEVLRRIGVPCEHPFWGCRVSFLDPGARQELQEALALAATRLGEALAGWSDDLDEIGLRLEPTLASVTKLGLVADYLRRAPEAEGPDLQAPWEEATATLNQVDADLREFQAADADLRPRVQAAFFSTDFAEIDQALAVKGDHWSRFFSPAFHRAKGRMVSLVGDVPVGTWRECIALEGRRRAAESRLEAASARVQALVGPIWQGTRTDPERLARLTPWVLALRADVGAGKVPAEFLASRRFQNPENLDRCDRAQRLGTLAGRAYLDVAKVLDFPRENLPHEPWTALHDRVQGWQAEFSRLGEMMSYRSVRADLPTESIGELADRWPDASSLLETAVLRAFFTGVMREATAERAALRQFDRTRLEATIAEFQNLDDFMLRHNRARVRLAHQSRLPTFANAVGNLGLLKVQCELQRRHRPIRWAMEQAGEAIQRIKPVFMMSPLSVAIHLPPQMVFDMVIFDEASQIKPEDALCAIARAKQVIVVGDTRQMPPTSFFDRLMDDSESDEESTTLVASEAKHLESILSLMRARVQDEARRPDLRWHYRSVHPTLIQPSNAMFYDRRLLVFPCPADRLGEVGLTSRVLPETVYEPGANRRVNEGEAEAIVRRAFELVQTRPQESILIAAMNKSQADLIYSKLALLQAAHPAVFMTHAGLHPHEPLEVKNLETVQGDERDVVLVSVTYGKGADGVLRRNFGPILVDGGDRRLNVLFTRARRRCEVFANFRADELRVDEGQAGLARLKTYLQCAEEGSWADFRPAEEVGPSVSSEIADALRAGGVKADSEAGWPCLDLVVSEALGVELDGPISAQARSARDRVKLRARALAQRGWSIHRTWAMDWWQNPDDEVQRILNSMSDDKQPAVDQIPGPQEPPAVQEFEAETEASTPIQPYVAHLPTAIPETDLIAYGIAVVHREGPIHPDLLFIRLRDALGRSSARGAIRDRLLETVERITAACRSFEDAIYVDSRQLAHARDWSERPDSERKISFVTEAELASVIRSVVRSSFGIAESQVPSVAASRLGFRAVRSASERLRAVTAKMLEHGGLVRTANGTLVVPDAPSPKSR